MKKMTAFLLTIVLLLAFAGCAEIEPVTAEEFRSTMEEAGLEVFDYTEEIDSEYCDIAYLAENEDYWIGFYHYIDEATAQRFYNVMKEDTEEQGGNYTNVSMQRFARYEATTSTEYFFVAWAGNTIVYSECAKADKESVRSALDLLGYV